LALEEVTALAAVPRDTQGSTQVVVGEVPLQPLAMLARLGLLVEGVPQILVVALAD
jgi:hypothetical protein